MGDIITIGRSKFERRRKDFCHHRHLIYSEENESIECSDCKEPIGPFQAFLVAVDGWQENQDSLDRRRTEVNELEKRMEAGLLKATIRVDEAWRRRKMVPCCPHCHAAILPEDGFGGSMTNKDMELERRAREIKP